MLLNIKRQIQLQRQVQQKQLTLKLFVCLHYSKLTSSELNVITLLDFTYCYQFEENNFIFLLCSSNFNLQFFTIYLLQIVSGSRLQPYLIFIFQFGVRTHYH
jgi:hypothetical protein